MSNVEARDNKVYIKGNSDAPFLTISSSGVIGASGDSVGFYGVTAQARPTALVQTYSTAALTHSALTSTTVATTAPTGTSPKGYSTTAQAGAIFRACNALRVDLANLKQFTNKVVDQLQANGLLQ